MAKEDMDQLRKSISAEHFENFDDETQLGIIKKLENSIGIIKATELEFSPDQFEILITHLENKLDDLQIIYNINTNRKLNEFL